MVALMAIGVTDYARSAAIANAPPVFNFQSRLAPELLQPITYQSAGQASRQAHASCASPVARLVPAMTLKQSLGGFVYCNCDISCFMTQFHISMCFDHLLKWIDPIGYGLNDSYFD